MENFRRAVYNCHIKILAVFTCVTILGFLSFYAHYDAYVRHVVNAHSLDSQSLISLAEARAIHDQSTATYVWMILMCLCIMFFLFFCGWECRQNLWQQCQEVWFPEHLLPRHTHYVQPLDEQGPRPTVMEDPPLQTIAEGAMEPTDTTAMVVVPFVEESV